MAIATSRIPPQLFRAWTVRAIRQGLDQSLAAFAHVLPTDRAAPVVLKPNANAAMNALTGNTTDLRLLAALLGWLRDQGYTNLTVAEGTNSGFYRNKIGVATRLRMDALAARFGARFVDCNFDEAVDVPFEDGIVAQVSRTCAQAALLINLPKLKTHFEAGMSVCLKNLMGCLVGQENKKKTHQALAANIIRLNEGLAPGLHIVDALVAMEGLGPTRGTPLRLAAVLVGEDPLVIDMACARLAGFRYDEIRPLRQAEARGLLTPARKAQAEAVDVSGVARSFAPPKAGPIATFIHHPSRQKYFLAIRNTPLFTRLAATEWFGELLFKTGLRQDKFLHQEMRLDRLEPTAACDGCPDPRPCVALCPLGHDPRALHAGTSRLPDACLGCLYCYAACPRAGLAFHGEQGYFAEQCRQYDAHLRCLAARSES
ncbi:DUF362 domain-containing protein [Megalodesulfovibrio gigas]|uniref:Putative iron-sulfur binding protein n=1 Tax=Megalodesulfovibrio gigas (strain ATCC 19364 / DSM 1382 / NCIMB 9332 / VKM B-1759) TaxID=1121448 RepID=T2GDS6_MEGG1|nr:DUF362 domain-containing protein [Megalodesulfovibrio gigas]AGW14735.1 putative iron-sulfur binding protein [Megalodesulfovibrio gigas DSM 1382 = ATCC 19364]